MNVLDESIHNIKCSVTSRLFVLCTALTFLWDKKQREWFMFAFPHLCSRLHLQFEKVTLNCISPPFQAILSPPGPRLSVIRNGWHDSHTIRTLIVSFKYAVKQFFKYSSNLTLLLEVGNCTGGDKHVVSELLTAPCKHTSAYKKKQRKAVHRPGSYLGVILYFFISINL